MSRKVGKKLLLAEEDGRIIGVRGAPKLYAEKAAICLFLDIFCGEVTFREETKAKPNSELRFEVFGSCTPGQKRLFICIIFCSGVRAGRGTCLRDSCRV